MSDDPSAMARADLGQLDGDDVDAPHILTALPGPRSAELWRRDAAHHAVNSSPAAQWLQIVIRDGAGALVRDVDGNVFLDFSSGAVVANLGHCPPTVVEAVREEAGRLLHYFDFATPPRPAFFEALAATLPSSLHTFQMYSTGSEAVEAALRLAKSYTKAYEIISFHRAWHGRTLGSMSLMGGFPLKHGYGPFAPGTHHSLNAYCYRCPLGLSPDRCEVACAQFIDRVYDESTEHELAAVIVEPVQGVGGVIPFPCEFLAHLRAFCDRTGAVLIFDEILTGMGRTGTMWAFEQSGVVPDILVVGKGLASGYPISLIASRREILDALPFGAPGAGASTFASGNLACAAGAATLGLLEDGTVLEHARRVGSQLLAGLHVIKERHRLIGDVRGVGMLLALELVADRETKERIAPAVARRLLLALARRGVLTAGAGPILRLTPPLVLTEAQAARGLEVLDQALTEVEAEGLG